MGDLSHVELESQPALLLMLVEGIFLVALLIALLVVVLQFALSIGSLASSMGSRALR